MNIKKLNEQLLKFIEADDVGKLDGWYVRVLEKDTPVNKIYYVKAYAKMYKLEKRDVFNKKYIDKIRLQGTVPKLNVEFDTTITYDYQEVPKSRNTGFLILQAESDITKLAREKNINIIQCVLINTDYNMTHVDKEKIQRYGFQESF